MTAPRANTALAVQGMASSFDTHGHFAVLLGLSFRHGRELTVDFGGFWGLFFNCGFHLGGNREPGLVGAFFG